MFTVRDPQRHRLRHLRLRRHEHALRGGDRASWRRWSSELQRGRTPRRRSRASILKGNRFGLGAGANIGELMSADRASSSPASSTAATRCSTRIEDGPLPWVALIDGFALGGIYELALACRAIVATEKSTVGFPEIRLNIFPGLGGTQRMPRRSGLVNADRSDRAATPASPPSCRARTSGPRTPPRST